MRSVLITGASGVLGSAARAVAARTERSVVATSRRPRAQWLRLELTEPRSIDDALDQAVDGNNVDTVLHLAAATAPVWAEQHPAETIAANVDGSAALARGCLTRRLRLLAMSTDLVFAGRDGGNYREGDAPQPLSHYARTKLDAERAILDANPDALVVRTSLLLAPARGHVDATDRALDSAEGARLCIDEVRSPILAEDLANALFELIDSDDRGLLHLAGPEPLSRLELGRILAGALGRPTERLLPVSRAELEIDPPRPGDISLDSSRAYALLTRTRIRSLRELPVDWVDTSRD